jgi:hypothetical protein
MSAHYSASRDHFSKKILLRLVWVEGLDGMDRPLRTVMGGHGEASNFMKAKKTFHVRAPIVLQ